MIERLMIDDSSAPSRQALLTDFLAEVWGRPYQLGQWDCILFIAAWADRLMAQGGGASRAPSLTSQFHGQYTTEAQAIRRFARHGINQAITTTLNAHGWQKIPITPHSPLPDPHFLPGDIILTDLHHPGIWKGAKIVAQPARASGLLHVHFRHAISILSWIGVGRDNEP